MKGLAIAPGLALPVEVAGEAIAILAKRGAGKTNTATVLVEELVGRGVQTVVVDPVGAWWGIRSSADGKRGLEVPILGGQHGDVPLEPTAGALIADVAVDTGQSLLLDLSDFPSKKAIASFVIDFADRLFRRKGREASLLHLVLEEADVVAPQKPSGGWRGNTGEMAASIEQLVRRGRSRGIGITMITQRSAVLNKDVLTQADVLIAMRTTGPQDIKAIREWINVHADEGADQVIPSLPSLATGEAWVWNPERGLLERVQVRKRSTYDSSRTPRAGEVRPEPRQVAPVDLERLGEQIAATVERARENDPAALRRRIRELERQLVEAEKAPAAVETIEVPVLTDEMMERLVATVDPAAEALVAIKALVDEFGALCRQLSTVQTTTKGGARGRAGGERARDDRVPAGDRPRRVPPRRSAPAAGRPAARADGGGAAGAGTARADLGGEVAAGLTGPEQRVLDAVAWYGALGISQPTKLQVGFIAGYRVGKRIGGTYGNVLGRLRSLGLVDYPSQGTVALTDAGAELARDPGIEPTDEGLQQAVFERLDGPERRVLANLIDVWPEPLSKRELGERSGYTVGDRIGGTFGNILGRLRSLGLIDYPDAGEAVALPVLFPSEAVR